MKFALRRNGARNPLDNTIPLDRSSTYREHRFGRAPAGRSNEAKIGQEEWAVKPNTLCHQ